MTWNVGIFESEAAAKDAAAKLTEAGFRERKVLFASRVAGKEEAAVRSIAKNARLPSSQVKDYAKPLQEGKSMVAVRPPADRTTEAVQILESGALNVFELTEPPAKSGAAASTSNASPLSDWLGLRVLTTSAPSADITLSEDPAPLSSRIGLEPLTTSKPFATIELSRDPAPLSSRIGLEPLTTSKPFAEIKLSDDPAPLSSLMGLGTVVPPKRPWETSLGFPLLLQDPAPLSSLLGLPTLTRKDS